MELKLFAHDQMQAEPTEDNPLALPPGLAQRKEQVNIETGELNRLVTALRRDLYLDLTTFFNQDHPGHDPAHALLDPLMKRLYTTLKRAQFVRDDLKYDSVALGSLPAVETLNQVWQGDRIARQLAIETIVEKLIEELPEPEIVPGDPLPHPHHHHEEKLVE